MGGGKGINELAECLCPMCMSCYDGSQMEKKTEELVQRHHKRIYFIQTLTFKDIPRKTVKEGDPKILYMSLIHIYEHTRQY